MSIEMNAFAGTVHGLASMLDVPLQFVRQRLQRVGALWDRFVEILIEPQQFFFDALQPSDVKSGARSSQILSILNL